MLTIENVLASGKIVQTKSIPIEGVGRIVSRGVTMLPLACIYGINFDESTDQLKISMENGNVVRFGDFPIPVQKEVYYTLYPIPKQYDTPPLFSSRFTLAPTGEAWLSLSRKHVLEIEQIVPYYRQSVFQGLRITFE